MIMYMLIGAIIIELMNAYYLFKFYRVSAVPCYLIGGLGAMLHVFYGLLGVGLINMHTTSYLILSNATVLLFCIGISRMLYTYVKHKKYKYAALLYFAIMIIALCMILPDMTMVYLPIEAMVLTHMVLFEHYSRHNGIAFRYNPFMNEDDFDTMDDNAKEELIEEIEEDYHNMWNRRDDK